MKVYLTHQRQTYIPVHDEELINIDDLLALEDASLKSININNFLDYVEYDKRNELLSEIVKKLRMGGELIISGIDFNLAVRYVSSNLYDIENINKVFMNGKVSCECSFNLIDFLNKCGLIDIVSKLNNTEYLISCRRKICQT